VYNSLNYDQQVEVRSHLSPSDLYARHFGNRDPVLIFVGRLTPWKQLDLLMAAAGQLHAAGAPVNVVIVGEGQIADTLRSEAEQRGIESRVWFFGACFDERALGELFANAAACVSPGEVGLTAMHAMVYGCPVVTHGDLSKQMPECEAVVEGATGALFARDDAESLLRAIQRVLALDRAHVAAQCRRMIDERYNPHRQIETLKAALSS
jgi:glycosyltransferase involved in cell wall biosynthesis